jgi:pilus assembly protein CpaE
MSRKRSEELEEVRGPVASQQQLIRMKPVSVVMMGPDDARRRALADALGKNQATVFREFGSYPNLNHLIKATGLNCDVVMIDLDADPETALDLVESICARNNSITVMVYSHVPQPDLLMRCMRAGAREFLVEPISNDALAEALIRAAARRQELDRNKKLSGQMLVFLGSKGGAGVTTVASNFALALAKESDKKVALIDLNLQLGDVALVLGMKPRYSVRDALANTNRLDAEFVSTLLEVHNSGLAVLCAADEYAPAAGVEDRGLEKLLYLLQDQFAYLVVDAGSAVATGGLAIGELADAIYLVTQVDVPSLRNSQRIISHLQSVMPDGRRLEVVANRCDGRKIEISLENIEKTIAAPVKWKMPNDYHSVHRSQNTGIPLVSESLPISKVLVQMARAACGKEVEPPKRRFSLFG